MNNLNANLTRRSSSFQGNQSSDEDVDHSTLINQLEYLCQHPKIFRILRKTLNVIKEGCKEQIAELECKITSALEQSPQITTAMKSKKQKVIMVITDDEGYEDYIKSLEKHYRYREKRVTEHLAIRRAFS